MPRESSKTRQWEKERRNRFNEGFSALSKLLPCYEPATTISKLDILRKAASYIEELQSQVNKLLVPKDNEETTLKEDEIKKLQERIKRLIGKNEQLVSLLKEAKITIPAGCSVIRKIKCIPQWSNRITPEQAKILQKKEQEGKKPNQNVKQRKFPTTNSNGKPPTIKTIRNRVARNENKKIKTRKKKLSKTPTKCIYVLSQPNPIPTQPCFVIAPSNGLVNQATTVTATTTAATTTATPEKSTKTFSTAASAPSGTLILTNTLIPVIQQSASMIPLQPRIIPLNSQPANSIIIVNNSSRNNNNNQNNGNNSNNVSLPKIKPKYCTTKTTQVNKVPIPALTSSSTSYLTNKKELVVSKIKKIKKTDKENKEKKCGEKRKLDESITTSTIDTSNATNTITTVTTAISDSSNREKIPKLDEGINEINKNDNEKQKQAEVAVDFEQSQPEKQQQQQEERQQEQFEAQENNKESTSNNKKVEETICNEKAVQESKKDNENEKIVKNATENIEININHDHHSELSNDIFATLHVQADGSGAGSNGSGGQNPESTSPTAAFLLAFPLVSTGGVKVTEVTAEDENNSESQRETPNLLQIGTMDTTKPTQSESLTPSLLNLDNLSFFSSRDFYSTQTFDAQPPPPPPTTIATTTTTTKAVKNDIKHVAEQQQQQQQEICQNLIENYDYRKMEQKQQQHSNKSTSYLQHKNFNINCNNFNNEIIKSSSYSLNISTGTTATRNYPDPLYTNSNNYYYNADPNFCQNNYKNPKTNTKTGYDSYTNSNFSTGSYYNNTSNSNNGKYPTASSVKQTKPPVNWMTTIEQNTSYILPFTSTGTTKDDYIYTSNTQNYFNTTTCYSNPTDKLELLPPPVNSCYPPPPAVPPPPQKEMEENQFSWSPPKLPQYLEGPHSFVSSTLPTLIGDLALSGSTTTFASNFDTRIDKYKERNNKEKRIKYDSNLQSGGNFLSVSQLVEHNNSNNGKERSPRRNRPKNSNTVPQTVPPPSKGTTSRKNKEIAGKIGYQQQQQQQHQQHQQDFCDNKNRKNSYSAEALIGNYNVMQHQQIGTTTNKQQNYSTTNKIPFLPESIIPYFPTVDLQTTAPPPPPPPPPPSQDYNNYNQNYQNFPTTYSNSFITTTTSVTTTTACTNNNNFLHDSTEFDLNLFPTAKDKNYQKNHNHQHHHHPSQHHHHHHHHHPQLKSCQKKSSSSTIVKKKQNDVFDFPFLPITSSINSPILPDDFHTASFLQPPTTQLYSSCKNSLYSKQNDLSGSLLPTLPPPPPPPPPPPSVAAAAPPPPPPAPAVTRNNIQHPEVSPNVVGTSSLTNFNLSTIFPEINKGVAGDSYLEPRGKEHKNYTTSSQVSFNNKPTFSFSYGSTSTSYH